MRRFLSEWKTLRSISPPSTRALQRCGGCLRRPAYRRNLYYAFLEFTELLKSPKRLAVDTAADSPIRTLADISADGRTIRILLSNPSDQAHVLRLTRASLPWSGATEYQEQIVDE